MNVAAAENYCHDPSAKAEWQRLLARHEGNPDVLYLYSLRQDLCANVDAGKLSLDAAIDRFEAERQARDQRPPESATEVGSAYGYRVEYPGMMPVAIFLLLRTAWPTLAVAATLTGHVVSIADGDTLTVLDARDEQHKIRLSGIDAPERGQPYGVRRSLGQASL